jgi:hypothetical protein
MTLPHIIMWAVALVVGVPSAWKNPTAGALVLCWVFSEGLFWLTGNNLAVAYYAYPDICAITIIIAKGIVRAGDRDWPDLTVWDKCIIGLFLLGAWPIYVSTLHPYYQWWALFYISIAQFLLAGGESAQAFLRSLRARSAFPPADNGLAFAGRAGGYV